LRVFRSGRPRRLRVLRINRTSVALRLAGTGRFVAKTPGHPGSWEMGPV
ncbi:ZNF267 isoform 4, partial [Pan troglodytes]